MKTSHLIVELIIVGIGTLTWLVLLILIFYDFDIEQVSILSKLEFLWITFGLALVYSLGILTDRIADSLFIKKAAKIKSGIYQEGDNVLSDKVIIYEKASPLVEMINYGRSRMRICRGWVINLFFIVLFGNILVTVRGGHAIGCYILLNLAGLLFGYGFYFAWKDLTKREYEKIKKISEALILK